MPTTPTAPAPATTSEVDARAPAGAAPTTLLPLTARLARTPPPAVLRSVDGAATGVTRRARSLPDRRERWASFARQTGAVARAPDLIPEPEVAALFARLLPLRRGAGASLADLAVLCAVGRGCEAGFRPSRDLRRVQPRGLHVHAAVDVLRLEHHVDVNADAALNVAKATRRLDASWVADGGRHRAARADFHALLLALEERSTRADTLWAAGTLLRMLTDASAPAARVRAVPPPHSPMLLSPVLIRFALTSGDVGAGLQAVTALTMQAAGRSLVAGAGDDVNATNAGLDKPADLVERTGAGLVGYEVSARPLTSARLVAMHRSVRRWTAADPSRTLERMHVLLAGDAGVDAPEVRTAPDGAGFLLGEARIGGLDIRVVRWEMWLNAQLAEMSGPRIEALHDAVGAWAVSAGRDADERWRAAQSG